MNKLSVMHSLAMLTALAVLGLYATGCESLDINETATADVSSGTGAGDTTGDTTAGSGGDTGTDTTVDGDWSPANSSYYGPNLSGATRDTRAVMHSADVDSGANVVRISYDTLPSDWPKQVNAPGMLCLFTKQADGRWLGGKFEWLDPGQTVKGLQNIDNGYNGWQRPAAGAQTAVVIFSTDGARHSNPAYTTFD